MGAETINWIKCGKLIVAILLISLSPVSSAQHEIYSDSNSSDEGIYLFFFELLEDAEVCMDEFVEESPNADNLATSFESLMNITEEEIVFYSSKGYKSNISKVVIPFSGLSAGIKELITYQSVFLANYDILKREENTTAYLVARSAVFKMQAGADEINRSLYEIESIELYNESSVLLFNASGCRVGLIDVYALIDTYESMLQWCEFEGLYVVVSEEHPFLFQDIGIQVYSKNAIPLSLVIDDCAYQLENQMDQTLQYNFKELGEYTIYAEGRSDDGRFIRSNVVLIDVGKIPTSIFLSSKDKALLEERVAITGLLVDYFNNPILAEVMINTGNGETVLRTDNEGYFQFYSTRSSEGYLNASAFYAGNDTYNTNDANISIFFSRFPVSLQIVVDKTYINASESNQTANVTGSVRGINKDHEIPLVIYANSTKVKTLNVSKDFNFSLNFDETGDYEIYATFEGDSLLNPAKSNEIEVKVEKELDGSMGGEEKANDLIIPLESIIDLAEEIGKSNGADSNMSDMIKLLGALSLGVEKISFYQSVFLDNYELLRNETNDSAYVQAKIAVIKMREGADEVNFTLDEIEYLKETSVLSFDVSDFRIQLNDVYALIDDYEEILEKSGFGGILIAVSNEHPYLYQNISVLIYSRNITFPSLIIGNCAYKLENKTDQLEKFSFKEIGTYEIYAEGTNKNGEIVKSNVITVDVEKIPTFIDLPPKYEAYLEDQVEIAGYLLDYLGRPIAAALMVKAGDKEIELTTDHKGYFQLYGTKSTEGYLNVSVFYPGNEIYKKSSADSSVFFSRFPIKLDIKAKKQRINTNETVDFIGSVDGIEDNYSIPIVINANSSSAKTIIVGKNFNFSLDFSDPGDFEIYASFKGDSLFKPANSNIVIISVDEKIDILSYVSIILLIIILSVVYMYAPTLRGKIYGLHGKAEKDTVVAIEKNEIEMIEEVPSNSFDAAYFENLGIEGAYKMLFDSVVSEKGLKRSLTPRELLKNIKNINDPFADLLKDVTGLYERCVYCSIDPTAEEMDNYFGMIRKIWAHEIMRE